jgi:DNA-binding CsgD family transcriptional regulator
MTPRVRSYPVTAGATGAADLLVCFPDRAGVSVGFRLASEIGRAGSREAAMAATARLLASETGGSAAAWCRSADALIFVAAEGLESPVRRRLVAAASPWLLSSDTPLSSLTRSFARIVGSTSPTALDLDVAFLVLSEPCPEIEASRADLASAVASIPAVPSAVVIREAAAGGSFEHEAIRRLTPREREILDLLATGLGTKQIADQLVISAKTVKTHIQSILAKLEARSRLEAVVRLRSLVP